MFVNSIAEIYSDRKIDISITHSGLKHLDKYISDVCTYFGKGNISTHNYVDIFTEKMKGFCEKCDLNNMNAFFTDYALRSKYEYLSKEQIDDVFDDKILGCKIKYIDVYKFLRQKEMFNDTRILYEIMIASVCHKLINRIFDRVIDVYRKTLFPHTYPKIINFEFDTRDNIQYKETLSITFDMIRDILVGDKLLFFNS